MCDTPDSRLCDRCKSSHYCSVACQRNDWPTHKLLCTTFSNFDLANRPHDLAFRAIYFPVDDTKPKLVWLQCKLYHDGDPPEPVHVPQYEELMGRSFVGRQLVESDPRLKRVMPNALFISFRDAFSHDGSEVNSSIHSITSISSGPHFAWRGPMLAYAMIGHYDDDDLGPVLFKDIDMKDFRLVCDYLKAFDRMRGNFRPPAVEKLIEGVRVNCRGDELMSSVPHFQAVKISSEHPIFSKHKTSDVADRIGLPIFSCNYRPSSKWWNDRSNSTFNGIDPRDNPDITYLHLCCDPEASQWGLDTSPNSHNHGSTLLVRQDKKPLLPWHAEALCRYSHEQVPYFAHSKGHSLTEQPMSRDSVLARISRPAFVVLWEQLVLKKQHEGEKEKVPSPYDM